MSRSIRHLLPLAQALRAPTAPRSLSLATRVSVASPASFRSLHSTPFRLLATPQTGPQTVSSGPIKTPNPSQTANATGASAGSLGNKGGPGSATGAGQGSALGTTAKAEYPDYSKGESALDKAAQLFFFTEILRGEFFACRTREGVGSKGLIERGRQLMERNVDCAGAILPTALYHHVPVRKGTAVPSIPW